MSYKSFMNNMSRLIYEGFKSIEIKGIQLPYIISSFGTINSYYYSDMEPFIDPETGYKKITLHDNLNTIVENIDILVARAFINNPNNFVSVRHIDGNKQNNCASNLEWIPETETTNNFIDDGMKICVCFRLYQTRSMDDISKEFNISIDTIKEIQRNYMGIFIGEYNPTDKYKNAYKSKVKYLRPFTMFLINKGKSDEEIAKELNTPKIQGARMESIERHVRYIRDLVLLKKK